MATECQCTMTEQLVGDGCYKCNPQLYTDHLKGEIETLTNQRDMLLEALKECSEDLMSWGEYAGEYFQNKHDLKGTFAKYQAIIKQVESER
jgi:hypothetical protein